MKKFEEDIDKDEIKGEIEDCEERMDESIEKLREYVEERNKQGWDIRI